MAIRIDDLKCGSVIRVRGSFGNGPILQGEVVGREFDDSKNAMVIDYEVDGETLWAYASQIVEVVSY